MAQDGQVEQVTKGARRLGVLTIDRSFKTNWLITQYPARLAAAITGAGISNWISD